MDDWRALQRVEVDGRDRQPLEATVGAQQVDDEVGGRLGQDGGRGVVLLQAARIHDRDPITQLDSLINIVRDEDDRLAHLPLNAEELVLEAFPRDPVDCPEGFVHEQDGWVGPERPSHADSLPLPTGELVRKAMCKLRRFKPDELEEIVDTTADPLLVPAEKPGHGCDIVGDVHVRKQARSPCAGGARPGRYG